MRHLVRLLLLIALALGLRRSCGSSRPAARVRCAPTAPPQALVVAPGRERDAHRPRSSRSWASCGIPLSSESSCCCAAQGGRAQGRRVRARRPAEPGADRGQAGAGRRGAPRGHLPRGQASRRWPRSPPRGRRRPRSSWPRPATPRRSATSTRRPRTSRATCSRTPTTCPPAAIGGAGLVARMVQRFRDVIAPLLPELSRAGPHPARGRDAGLAGGAGDRRRRSARASRRCS